MSNKIYIRVNDEIFLGVSGVEFNARENDTIVIILEVDHDGISPKVYTKKTKLLMSQMQGCYLGSVLAYLV